MHKYSLLRQAQFRNFLSLRLLSTFAAQMQSVAVAWQVYEQTSRPIDLGYVGLAIFIPFFITSFFSGDFVDRKNRLKVLGFCQIALGIASAALLILSMFFSQHIWLIFLILAFVGFTRAFMGPAGSSVLPNIVPKDQLMSAIAWNSTTWQLGTVLGPALGGFLFHLVGKSTVYGVCCLFFSGAFFLSTKIDFPFILPTSTLKFWQRLSLGLKFTWQTKIILAAISLDLFAVLLGGAVALLPVFTKDILHTGPEGLGILRSAAPLGAMVMALYFSQRPLKKRVGKIMLGSVFLFGLATIVFGISKHFWLSFSALVLLGITDMVSVVVRQTLIQLKTPDDMRGRVSAVSQVFIGASNELGEFESGLTAQWWGPEIATVVGGLGTCFIVLLWSVLFKELRKTDSF